MITQQKTFIDPIFSKPIYGKLTDIDTKKVVSLLEENYDNSLYVLDDKRFKFLKDELIKEFYFFSLGRMKYTNRFEITTSWFTKSTKGQSSKYHNHTNCMISGVLYLQTNENSGNISFKNYNDKRFNIKIEKNNIFNSPEHEITPVDGMLILFPSEVWHKNEENKSDSIKYSLAFNLTPTGLVGDHLNNNHMKIKVMNSMNIQSNLEREKEKEKRREQKYGIL